MVYKCALCDKTFRLNTSLYRHFKQKHDYNKEETKNKEEKKSDVAFKCPLCDRTFTTKTNLNRHVKEKHKHKEEEEQQKSNMAFEFKCSLCDRKFSTQSNVNRHVKENHKKEDEEKRKVYCALCERSFKRNEHLQTHLNTVHLMQKKIKCSNCEFSTHSRYSMKSHIQAKHSISSQKLKLKEDAKRLFQCNFCSTKYSHRQTLRKHLIKSHGQKKSEKKGKTNCPLCKLTVVNDGKLNRTMLYHFKNVHDLPIESKTIEFENVSQFQSWKIKMEKETASQFILRMKKINYERYICRRTGNYRSKGTGKRHIKLQGSCKINSYCPASMSCFLKENGSLVIDFIDTHIGHTCDLAHTTLTTQDRHDIASKLASKIPKGEILKEIRNSVNNTGFQRLHLTNLNDLSNIERDFELAHSSGKHSSDNISIDDWVKEFASQNGNGLIYYKPESEFDKSHPELLESDFVLLFMTELQIDIFLKYSGDVVCVDGTYEMNNEFQLYTVLVIDDTREAMPVAFLFSNRHNETILKIFFENIKSNIGRKCSKFFMSNTDEVFYAVWSEVMGKSDQQLYYTRSVLKVWRQSIIKKIRLNKKRQSVYKTLQALSYETDEQSFLNQAKLAYEEWTTENDLKEFAAFFNEHYLKEEKFKKWAYCFRVGAGISTTMALENFNQTLKHITLNGKRIKQNDLTIGSLLQFITNKFFDILLKKNRGQVVSKLKILRRRHREALTMESTSIFPEENNKWKVVSSESTDEHIVRRVQSRPCVCCSLPCSHCKSCFHQFACSCNDHRIRYNMCKHIHMVAKSMIENEDDVSETNYCEDLEMEVEEVESEDVIDFEHNYVKKVREKGKSEKVILEKAKSQFLQQFKELVKKVTTLEELKAVQEQCEPVASILDSSGSTSSPFLHKLLTS